MKFPKYQRAYCSDFQRLKCLLYCDWYELSREAGGSPVKMSLAPSLAAIRRRRKQVARLLGRWFDKAGPLLSSTRLKQVVNRLLVVLTSRPMDHRRVVVPIRAALRRFIDKRGAVPIVD